MVRVVSVVSPSGVSSMKTKFVSFTNTDFCLQSVEEATSYGYSYKLKPSEARFVSFALSVPGPKYANAGCHDQGPLDPISRVDIPTLLARQRPLDPGLSAMGRSLVPYSSAPASAEPTLGDIVRFYIEDRKELPQTHGYMARLGSGQIDELFFSSKQRPLDPGLSAMGRSLVPYSSAPASAEPTLGDIVRFYIEDRKELPQMERITAQPSLPIPVPAVVNQPVATNTSIDPLNDDPDRKAALHDHLMAIVEDFPNATAMSWASKGVDWGTLFEKIANDQVLGGIFHKKGVLDCLEAACVTAAKIGPLARKDTTSYGELLRVFTPIDLVEATFRAYCRNHQDVWAKPGFDILSELEIMGGERGYISTVNQSLPLIWMPASFGGLSNLTGLNRLTGLLEVLEPLLLEHLARGLMIFGETFSLFAYCTCLAFCNYFIPAVVRDIINFNGARLEAVQLLFGTRFPDWFLSVAPRWCQRLWFTLLCGTLSGWYKNRMKKNNSSPDQNHGDRNL